MGGVGRRQRGSKAGREGVKQGEREEGDRVERDEKEHLREGEGRKIVRKGSLGGREGKRDERCDLEGKRYTNLWLTMYIILFQLSPAIILQ